MYSVERKTLYPSQPGLKSLATGPRAMPYCPLGGGGIIPATGLTVAGVLTLGTERERFRVMKSWG